MKVMEAIIAIQRLERRNTILTALEPVVGIECGLKVHRVAKTPTDELLFVYVDRLEYIAHLKQKFNLHKKREPLYELLRNRLRK